MYGPSEAVVAGILDEVVPVEDLAKRSREVALGLCAIDLTAHYQTKLRVRDQCIPALQAAIESEFGN